MLQIGDKAPDFLAENDEEKKVSLKDYSGKRVVLYFYPKDNTSGCTTEAIEFSDLINSFKDLDTEIIGVSPDSVKSHINFKNKHNLNITLISDPEKEICQAYDVWREKSMYGKKYMGVLRSTFIISSDGIIEKAMYNVKAKGHAEAVLCDLKK